jgi:hypothetical protein
VGVETLYSWTVQVLNVSGWQETFSLLLNVLTEAYPASYLMECGALSQGVKEAGFELNHSHPSSAFIAWTGKTFTSGVKSDKT